MAENCSNCLQAKLIEKLDERVGKLEEQCESAKEKIATIEKNASAAEEKTKTLFNLLDDIKKSIEKIASKIEKLEERPANRWEQLMSSVIALAVGAAFAYFFKK